VILLAGPPAIFSGMPEIDALAGDPYPGPPAASTGATTTGSASGRTGIGQTSHPDIVDVHVALAAAERGHAVLTSHDANISNVNPRHLRAVLDEYVTHYNRHLPHRGQEAAATGRDGVTALVADLAMARIQRHGVLGGLIHEHRRAA
jgi:hypothetical protein